MLYSLAIEPMLSRIRKALSGVKLSVNCVPLHLSAYADDIIVAVNNDGDVEKLMKITESFEKMSSSKVNWAKSSALLSGNWHGRVPKLPDGIFWKDIASSIWECTWVMTLQRKGTGREWWRRWRAGWGGGAGSCPGCHTEAEPSLLTTGWPLLCGTV